MKKVNIFIGSSIDEFKNERADITDFIYSLGYLLEDNYGLKVKPKVCENADPAMAATRKQDDFNGLIAESDICLFLFCTRAGIYSIEEMDVAFKLIKKRNDGKPIVNVFFRTPREGDVVDDSIAEQRARIDSAYRYDVDYRHFVGNVKFKVIRDLLALKKGTFPVSVRMADVSRHSERKIRCCLVIADRCILELDETDLFAKDSGLKGLRDELEKNFDALEGSFKGKAEEFERLVKGKLGLE